MRKTLATLSCALLAAIGLRAQNTALQFDGVDDYLEAQSFPPLAMFSNNATTVEFTFQKSTDKPRQVLLAQSNRNGKFIIGINALGEPYTEIGGIVHEAQGVHLENYLCYHLSIVYLPGTIDFYLNGQGVASVPNQSTNNCLDQNQAFYIGQDYPIANTTLHGEIDDMRIFADERTQTEIQLYTFTELPLAVDNKFVYFSFNQMAGNHYPDPYYSNTKAWPGGRQLVHHEAPQTVEGHCTEQLPQPESISTLCQPMPTCNATGLPPGELLCNGNFEQYCSLLNGTQQSWVIPEHPFKSFGLPTVAGSDISNWHPTNNTFGQPSSPDFYVRNGVGSPINFHPVWPNAVSTQWLQHTPTNTWSGNGNGVTGIISEANLWRERIYSDLNQNLSPNTTYQFSGWFYTTTVADPTWVSGAGYPGYITITFSDATGNNFITAGTVQIPHWDMVSNNNHW
jgi:hypothetical protein